KADLERHRRMEACFYKHGKEWEATKGPGSWGTDDWGPRKYMRTSGRRWHPSWDLVQEREFQRSDYVHPSHNCSDSPVHVMGQATDELDDFDRTINYGDRRDRLRKTFEWELDRLYLAEELKKRRQDKLHGLGDKLQKDGHTSDEDEHQEDDRLATYALAKLNRLQWLSFKDLSSQGEKDACVMDILVGEPDISEDLGAYRLWYGYSGHSAQTPDAPQEVNTLPPAAPGESPLPERIRIHSAVLYQILGTVLGKTLHTRTESTVVLIRPFKALTYCEPALRDWCAALEKKFAKEDQTSVESRDEQQTEADDSDGDEDEVPELTKSPIAMEHLKCLLSFMDTDILDRQKHLNNFDSCKVFFPDLWHIFRPGTKVVDKDGKQAYRVIKVTSARHSKKAAFSITCIHIDFDGKHLGPVRSVFDMKRFDGERDITALDVYPLRFHPIRRAEFSKSEWSATMILPANQRYRQKLVHRGGTFLAVASVKHMYYAGPTLGLRDEIESQVVIDFETAFTVENGAQKSWMPYLETLIGGSTAEEDEEDKDESCRAACCRRDAVHDDSYVDEKQSSGYVDNLLPKAGSLDEQLSVAVIPRPLEELYSCTGETLISDDDLLIMSHRVFGFVLRNRKWAQLDLSYLIDVHQDEKSIVLGEGESEVANKKENKEHITAFDRLVLEEWHRPMIESLIAQHFRDKKSTTGEREEFDIVKGKGDLGTTAAEVEKALEMNFALANRWDCILLLDEADVFLSQRTKEDFRRNGLAAVFLRVMEYYAGILFLTTNGVGDFDEAFTSCIHVSLLYRELDREKTIEVFKINLDTIEARFKRKGRVVKVDKAGIGSFASEHFTDYSKARWNGRQIRNACQTALALAEYEAHGKSHSVAPLPGAEVTLDVNHFKIVRKAYVEFTEYMNNLYNMDSTERAKDNGLRAIWVDNDNRIVDQKKANFLRGSQGQSLASHP
ncbi:hypothetical protein BDP81DRAFT_307917, partial [Colletotrichum phormii]